MIWRPGFFVEEPVLGEAEEEGIRWFPGPIDRCEVDSEEEAERSNAGNEFVCFRSKEYGDFLLIVLMMLPGCFLNRLGSNDATAGERGMYPMRNSALVVVTAPWTLMRVFFC